MYDSLCACELGSICIRMFTSLSHVIQKVRELIEEFNSKERFVAALIVEPIQSEGG